MSRVGRVLRRVYSELVRGRTTVRVQPASEAELGGRPIFLVGVFRSGTTLTRYVVDSHSRIACPPESNFVRWLAPIVHQREDREALASMGFDEEHVLQRLRSFVAYFFENYARTRGKPRWADKTPAYVEHLEFLHRLFPEAQFVLIYRHGLDVAASIAKMGSGKPGFVEPYGPEGCDVRVAAAAYWAEMSARMRAFEAAHPSACHRLVYEDLCAEPERVARELFAFLGEAWEPQVLEYHRFDHDRGFEDGRAASARGFEISRGRYLEWPPEVLEAARAAAQDELAALGYRD